MTLQESISSLPQAIQILISEFNVDHRVLLRNVHQEYLTIIYPLCRVCDKPFDAIFCSMDYFILKRYKMDCHWCGLDCFEKESDTELKINCLRSVQEYVEGEP